MFRLRSKRSDSQVPPGNSQPESSPGEEFQSPAESPNDDNGGSVIETSTGAEPDDIGQPAIEMSAGAERDDIGEPLNESPPDAEGDVIGESVIELSPGADPNMSRPELALREVGDFLSGRGPEPGRIDPADKEIRAGVADHLLAVISGYKTQSTPHGSDSDAANNGHDPLASETDSDSQVKQSVQQGVDADEAAKDRAHQMFMEHGYFDELVAILSGGGTPGERAAAARTIGMLGNQLGNVHLIAALFDHSHEVSEAATQALARLGHSSAATAAMTNPPMDGGSPAAFAEALVEEGGSQIETADLESDAPKDAANPVSVEDKIVPADETKLLLEEQAARETLEDLRQRLGDTVSSRTRLEKEAELRLESEARISAEVAARRREEEQVRQRLEEEAARRKTAEDEKLAAAHVASINAEEEVRRLAQDDAKLRNEVNRLRLVAEHLARTRMDLKAERATTAERTRLIEITRARDEAASAHQAETKRLRSEEEELRRSLAELTELRTDVETALEEANREALRLADERDQLAVAEAARRMEADRLRREAAERERDEQEQLQVQLEEMRRITEEIAARRSEVEAARERAIADDQRLVEAQARMNAAEESRQASEAERLRLEATMVQRADEERRLLDEVRVRAQEQQRKIEEAERSRAAEQEQRLAQLAALRQRMEEEAQQRSEKERQLSSQIESFRIAEMQARKRIEEAEARRRSADERYRLTAEKMQRVEAEARKGELEEQRILARLEEVRRNVAVATQLAVEQQKRIKEETEQLRRLEEEQRHRLEEASRSRVEAEQRWQQEKDRFKSEEDERLRAAKQLKHLMNPEAPSINEDAGEWRDDPAENLRPAKRSVVAGTQTAIAAPAARSASASSLASFGLDPHSNVRSAGSTAVYGEPKTGAAQVSVNGDSSGTPGITLATPSLVSEKDGFNRISARFDDPSPEVRNAAARELRELDPLRMVEWLNRALEEAPSERRRNIGSAIAASGLASEVIDLLGGESREDTYSALCLLLTMAKGGEVQPLIEAIENHENVYVRIAAVRLLTLNGQEEIANAAARRRLEGRK